MSYIRPASHAGSWYTNNSAKLCAQLEAYFHQAESLGNSLSGENTRGPIDGARILIGPHAGFAYSGERLAETFTVWDTSKVKRVFLLGPSHHVYFKNSVLLSQYDMYETPFGNIPVDTETIEQLLKVKSHSHSRDAVFKYMSEEIDDDEHSFEMHAPFIYYKTKDIPQGIPKIVPILISGMDEKLNDDLVSALLPYVAGEENHFIISSDFCHWGSRFGYTKYLPQKEDSLSILHNDLTSLGYNTKIKSNDLPIHKSIEVLDRAAMEIASTGSYNDWKTYISHTGNTICGQKPIAVILRLLQKHKEGRGISKSDNESVFQWIGYSQSNQARRASDSSVSYASGYVTI
ncbi:MEMO1 family [Scheffersomyces xylosifermentans]|uniref:MEMO1 family n=1 Tax=Scheffersomyces xylosifermentans TaxID=1304137 RepID=UPI00315D6227